MELFGTTGQERRAWLDGIDAQISEALRYYLGPTGIDKKVNALAQVAPMFMDGTDVVDAQAANDRFWASPSVPNALAMAAPMAALAVPGVSNRLAQGMADTGADLVDAGQRFVRDESGALRLYHGSPHDFDEFSLSKIGTGEGAQAYGHGLYFAESEDVARGYRDALRFPRIDSPSTPRDAVIDDLNYHKGDIDGVRSIYEGMASSGNPDAAKMASEKLSLLDAVVSDNPGRMYEVEVNANPDDFLDWDRPLSEQPQRVQDAAEMARRAYLSANYPNNPEYLTSGFPSHLKDGLPAGRAIGSATAGNATSPIVASGMREAGIPGIRYFDAGSRGAGDGSRNYVVFDDKLISILRKYGMIPGAVGLGANALSYDENKREIRDYLGGV